MFGQRDRESESDLDDFTECPSCGSYDTEHHDDQLHCNSCEEQARNERLARLQTDFMQRNSPPMPTPDVIVDDNERVAEAERKWARAMWGKS